MRFIVLGLFFAALLAAPAFAQELTPFDWSTAVIYPFLVDAGAMEIGATASAEPGAVSPPAQPRFDSLPPGSAVSAKLTHVTTELIDVARAAGIHVLAEVRSDEADLDRAAAAVRAGLSGFVLYGDERPFRASLEKRLSPETVFTVVVTGSPGGDGAPALVDPPDNMLNGRVDWESVYSDHRPAGITHIRVDQWAPAIHLPLMLVPGGIYLDGDLSGTAALVAAFRARHPAVGAGQHEALINTVYTFHRGINTRSGRDDVVVVLGAEGKTSINVSRVFPDDTLLLDAMTGATAFVSFGLARFDAHPSGLILIEELR